MRTAGLAGRVPSFRPVVTTSTRHEQSQKLEKTPHHTRHTHATPTCTEPSQGPPTLPRTPPSCRGGGVSCLVALLNVRDLLPEDLGGRVYCGCTLSSKICMSSAAAQSCTVLDLPHPPTQARLAVRHAVLLHGRAAARPCYVVGWCGCAAPEDQCVVCVPDISGYARRTRHPPSISSTSGWLSLSSPSPSPSSLAS